LSLPVNCEPSIHLIRPTANNDAINSHAGT
jgi:hypothetical protein